MLTCCRKKNGQFGDTVFEIERMKLIDRMETWGKEKLEESEMIAVIK